MEKALFLDRDGIINVDSGYVHRPEDFQLTEGIIPLCQYAVQKRYKLIVITNQSGIARGMYTGLALEKLHRYMRNIFKDHQLFFSAIYYCPHHPNFSGRCLCRKPNSLLFERALAACKLSAGDCWMLGDHERDIKPAYQLRMKTALLGSKHNHWANICIDKLSDLRPYL